MKIIENYLSQPRPYADSEGWLKIELEQDDDRKAIIDQYHKAKSNPYDESCIFMQTLSTDKILVFKRHQVFLD